MRQIVLDTETTGLNARLGDRIIEIGRVELVDRRLTGNHFHRYVNPERDIEEGALKVHGITTDFLQDKPVFAQVAADFLAYVRGAELVIHNAAFDVEFLNEELKRLGLASIETVVAGVVDTLRTARDLHPGKKNSLDALCERYAIDNAHRTLHGALLDAELLADVYLAMTRGQETLAIEVESVATAAAGAAVATLERHSLLVLTASDDEAAAHAAVLEGIAKETRGRCVWLAEPPALEAPAAA
jgi:DNA polymerase-3 subunit epsilon